MKINKETAQKIGGIVMAVGAGVFAVINSLTDQKKDREFEEMKEAIKQLQNK